MGAGNTRPSDSASDSASDTEPQRGPLVASPPPPLVTTGLSAVDGAKGVLTYRGYPVEVLHEARIAYADAVGLLLDGELPAPTGFESLAAQRSESARPVTSAAQGRGFVEERWALELLPTHIHDLIQAHAGQLPPMALLRACISLADDKSDPHAWIAHVGNAVAAIGATGAGRSPVTSLPTRTARMLASIVGDDDGADALDACLVLHLDHALNPSTLACRVVASTGAGLSACIAAGVAALEGPLHGGASTEVGRTLAALASPDDVEPWLAAALAARRRIPGFGHPIYQVLDPRARILKGLAEQVARRRGSQYFDVASRLEDCVWQQKRLHPNVDFYAATLYATLGIPLELHTPLFAAARVSGWCAHALEQQRRGRLLSPEASYDGPARRTSSPG